MWLWKFKQCPEDKDLTRHERGELKPARTTFIATHLERCGRCRERLEQLRKDAALVALVLEAHAEIPHGHRERLTSSMLRLGKALSREGSQPPPGQ